MPEATGDKILWIPIFIELGEKAIARIMEESPDMASKILAARENFKRAEEEADDLKKMGHE